MKIIFINRMIRVQQWTVTFPANFHSIGEGHKLTLGNVPHLGSIELTLGYRLLGEEAQLLH